MRPGGGFAPLLLLRQVHLQVLPVDLSGQQFFAHLMQPLWRCWHWVLTSAEAVYQVLQVLALTQNQRVSLGFLVGDVGDELLGLSVYFKRDLLDLRLALWGLDGRRPLHYAQVSRFVALVTLCALWAGLCLRPLMLFEQVGDVDGARYGLEPLQRETGAWREVRATLTGSRVVTEDACGAVASWSVHWTSQTETPGSARA